jgi:hypothetical protein
MSNLIESSVVEALNKSVENAVAQKLLSAQSNQEEIKSHLQKLSDTIENNRKAELSAISQILKLLGKSSGESIKKRNTVKITDDEIKEKLIVIIPENGLSGKSIQDQIGISYTRFTIFNNNNPDFLRKEGNKKTTVYFIK